MALNIYFAIIANDEESSIKLTIKSLLSQTLFYSDAIAIDYVNVSVFANGCKDDTAKVAKQALQELRPHVAGFDLETDVVEFELGDKATTWNRFVHEYAKDDATYLFMVDGDILINNEATCELLVQSLEDNPDAVISSSTAIKDTSIQAKQSLLDKCSNYITRLEQDVRMSAVTGGLMCGRSSFLKRLWLPAYLLNIDGILTTIAKTDFFTSQEHNHERVINPAGATFVFEAYRDIRLLYFNHCRRYIGHVIRDYLDKELRAMSARGIDPATSLKERYATDPNWLQAEIMSTIKKEKSSLVPWHVLTMRINQFIASRKNRSLRKIPIILLATIWQAMVLVGVRHFLAKGDLRRVWRNSQNARLVDTK